MSVADFKMAAVSIEEYTQYKGMPGSLTVERAIPGVNFLRLNISIFFLIFKRYLHYVLSKNSVVNETNRGLMVETLRSIAEILIWGDQNDSRVFEYVYIVCF